MANGFVLRNVTVGIDGVDLSDHIRDVGVEMSAAEVPTTAMGAGGVQRLAGIRDDKFTFTAYSDFSAGKIHATINPKFASAGTFEVKVTASGSTIGTANPLFIGYCPALTYSPVSGAVGDAAMTPLSFPCNGTITVSATGTIP
jgi:hypothetical protein